jgi:hypothetical protein
MEKLSITIDVTKIDKSKITDRKFTNKNGEEITAKDLKLDVVPLKEPKKIKEGDTWEMWKTHFVVVPQTKEERENEVPSVFVGDGLMFKSKKEAPQEQVVDVTQTDESDIDVNDIPF